MTKVSNSQIMDWQKCQKRFDFSQIMKLRPKDFPEPLSRGLGGHSLMEIFFKTMQQGGDYRDCVAACDDVLVTLATDNPSGLSVYRHVLAFGAFALQQEWEIVDVEESMFYNLPDGNTFVFTPDLVVRYTKGVMRGKLGMYDFKFTGQYWTEKEISVYQQIPKYSLYYKLIRGEVIRAGYLVMLNTRAATGATGERLYLIKPVDLNKKKLERIRLENELLVAEVANAKQNPEQVFTRTVDTYACKLCWFGDDICPMDMAGLPIKRTADTNYIVNDYFDQYEELDNG